MEDLTFYRLTATTTNYHRQTFQLRITQQLDRRIKSIHIKMSDTTNHLNKEKVKINNSMIKIIG